MEHLATLISSTPARMGGIPCFRGTRVPVHTLFDYVASGKTVDAFVDDFPTVPRAQAAAVLGLAGEYLDMLLASRARQMNGLPVPEPVTHRS